MFYDLRILETEWQITFLNGQEDILCVLLRGDIECPSIKQLGDVWRVSWTPSSNMYDSGKV